MREIYFRFWGNKNATWLLLAIYGSKLSASIMLGKSLMSTFEWYYEDFKSDNSDVSRGQNIIFST